MDIKHMEYFCKVAELKSFTKAAKRLYVSQPTVTNTIHQLEEELNVKLFTRTTKYVTLTPKGRVFQIKAQQILASIESAIAEVKNLDRDITLEVSNLMYNSLFLKLIMEFEKYFPQLSLKISENGSNTIFENLKRGNSDIGIFAFPVNISEIKTIPLFQEEVVFCTSKFNEVKCGKSIDIQDLREQRFVTLSKDHIYQEIMTNICLKEGFLPDIMFTTNKIDSIKKTIKSNIASSFLLRSYIEDDPDIQAFTLNPPIKITMGIGWNENDEVNKKLKPLITFIEEFYNSYSINEEKDIG
ncbi:LysR family transcriptional regulator [Bacillus rubiinfantis]|uniref:LysR family transcriptional regulator n=1 Tax=Bacillus rubiinfantis TaxID=1499680 RepID=UPI0005A719DB|nr:LysR family transcriptional regulator [Bacillus rubiinfantis]